MGIDSVIWPNFGLDVMLKNRLILYVVNLDFKINIFGV